MKKILLILFTITFTYSANAQITKIESEKAINEYKISPMGIFGAEMKVYEDYSSLSFKDVEYQTITKIVEFQLNNETMDDLYDLLVSDDAKEGDFYKVETTGSEYVYISFNKSMGKIYPTLYLYESKNDPKPSRMQYFNNKQLKKLFGKKK